jgi:hypothetical protein
MVFLLPEGESPPACWGKITGVNTWEIERIRQREKFEFSWMEVVLARNIVARPVNIAALQIKPNA